MDCTEPGWRRLALRVEDSSGRRGVWIRTTPAEPHRGAPVTVLEVCAGREGDDYSATLRAGEVLSHEVLYWLSEALTHDVLWFMPDVHCETCSCQMPPEEAA